MLDTNARKYVQPLLDAVARAAQRAGVSANALTVAGMLVGVVAAAPGRGRTSRRGISRAVAFRPDRRGRRNARPPDRSSSPLGAILDITFDRVVELSMVTAIAWRFPEARFELVVLAGVIAIAMSLFLSIGAAIQNRIVKSFHYAPGLGERTEAFICLSLMILDSERLVLWTWVFVGVIVFTMAQRLRHAHEMLKE